MVPQAPLPPEIEGYLKKLKRKTSNLTGGWNKRWFFVDPKRLEFGYSKSKAPNAPKSSIYLNDITAVLQFDDTHFQVESRTRNFFLCGESKASTTCWVKSLDEYRKKLIEYEKDLAKLAAAIPSSISTAATVSTLSATPAPTTGPSNQAKPGVDSGKKTTSKKTKKSAEPARDSQQDHSSSASLSVSSSSNLTEEKPARYVNVGDTAAALDEHRSPSPIEAPRRFERRESKSKGLTTGSSERPRERERDSVDRDSRERGRDKSDDHDRDNDERERERRGREKSAKDRDRERERERDRDRDRDREADDERSSKRDRSTSAQRRTSNGKQPPASGSSSRTSSGRGVARPGNHPTHGYVMHAWMDEYD